MQLTFMAQNLEFGGLRDGEGTMRDRWPLLVKRITAVDPKPDFLLLSEAEGWDKYGHRYLSRAANELDMDALFSSSQNGQGVVLLYRRETVGRWQRWNADYTEQVTHSFGVGSFDVGLPSLLSVVPVHLDPFRIEKALSEIGLITSRGYRYGPFGVIGGDLNYASSRGPEPEYSEMKPYNIAARTVHGDPTEEQELRPDRRIGWALEKADYVDVAYHLSEQTGDESLLQRTARSDRIDQFWVTKPLAPAITSYEVVDTPADASDHKGIVFGLDTEKVDSSVAMEYT
ncbi:MAG: hypothetical protein WD846_00575 [Patescibacteria group bacterium]